MAAAAKLIAATISAFGIFVKISFSSCLSAYNYTRRHACMTADKVLFYLLSQRNFNAFLQHRFGSSRERPYRRAVLDSCQSSRVCIPVLFYADRRE